MKYKVDELEGVLLDAAVAKAELLIPNNSVVLSRLGRGPGYSSEWADGGPIIERELIETTPLGECWSGRLRLPHGVFSALGPTPLIAAMRAYVASKFGDEVELP